MRHITVVDARMGRGKSSAAIRYMNERKREQRFLFVTPYLTEVDRVCSHCGFEEPVGEDRSKSFMLKQLLTKRKNIASTHALFSIMDDEALELVRANGYSLIIDESIEVISHVPASRRDTELLLDNLIEVDDENRVIWRDADYEGRFDGYKEIADARELCFINGSFYQVMNPQRFLPFKEVFMMTYLFDGQLARAYFDFFGFDYDVIGVEQDDGGYRFSDKPDAPPPVDYSRLIRIVDDERMNKVGDGKNALSLAWYTKVGSSGSDVKLLRNNMRHFFDRMTTGTSRNRLWTTFKGNMAWLLGPRNRFQSSFLALNARATNAYRDATSVAYLVNRFVDPNIAKFFASKDIRVDPDLFALSEMLQFIWRSAIRDDKEIYLYIPSRRMRDLLTGWMNTTNGGT